MYKEIDNRVDYMRKVRRVLKPGGRVAIIEYRPGATVVGPPPEMRLSSEQVKGELTASGFTLGKEYDFLPREYFLIFVKDGNEFGHGGSTGGRYRRYGSP